MFLAYAFGLSLRRKDVGFPKGTARTTGAPEDGAPGRIRTGDPRFRKPVLYPAELRERSYYIRVRPTEIWVSPPTEEQEIARISPFF